MIIAYSSACRCKLPYLDKMRYRFSCFTTSATPYPCGCLAYSSLRQTRCLRMVLAMVKASAPWYTSFLGKKIFPPPLLGFFLALVFLYAQIPLPTVLHNTLNYIGNMVTPLSLLYIGIVLHDAGLKSMRLNKDSIGGIIGRFAVAPFIMFCVIYATKYLMGITLEPVAVVTFIVQSAGPVIAVLPIVANEAGSDLPFATGLVTISSVLFVFVIPVIMEILTLFGIGM